MTFYVIAAVVSAVSLTADMILRYMEKIKSFGQETRFHNIKGKTIPVEDFIPYNFTMTSVFFLTLGVTGIIMKLLDINGLVAFPVSVLNAAIVNFIIMHFIYPVFFVKKLPDNEDLSECEAVCTETIVPESYGRVSVVWKNERYEFPAVSANENRIEKDEAVIILYREEGLCFVETPGRLGDVLND